MRCPEGDPRPQAEGAPVSATPVHHGAAPPSPRLAARLALVLLIVLLAFAALVAVLFRHEWREREGRVLQQLSAGLAAHIVNRWPQLAEAPAALKGAAAHASLKGAAAPASPEGAAAQAAAEGAAARAAPPDGAARAARRELIAMLEAVNPGVQVYLLDASGRVVEYLGEPGMVREHAVSLDEVRRFLGGAELPLRSTDPMGSGEPRLFSAAMFPPREGAPPPGYLYVVLDGAARQAAAGRAGDAVPWPRAGAAALLGFLLAGALGVLAVRRIAQPLEAAFARMAARIEAQAGAERERATEHRAAMAALAHDLRTPLTALHGQLEALASRGDGGAAPPDALLAAALAQSERVRRLTQQLFELAALQAADQAPRQERFRLDELVADAVATFRGAAPPAPGHGEAATAPVELAGEPPGALAVQGDLELVERALSNLIDNARRHGHGPVRVRLAAEGGEARIVVEDGGPGLPEALHAQLLRGDPIAPGSARAVAATGPDRRGAAPGSVGAGRGGLGGLGLAIAQRIATLHGGSLRPLPAPPGGGLRLCFSLPLAR
jgi:signal transduction histidine kinase